MSDFDEIWQYLDPKNLNKWGGYKKKPAPRDYSSEGYPLFVSVSDMVDYAYQEQKGTGWNHKKQVGGGTVAQKQAVSDILDLIAFLETERRDVSQGDLIGLTEREKQYHSGPGQGYYQLETSSDGGGYTRANTGYSRIPKHLTPAWFQEHLVIARENDNTWHAGVNAKAGQDFVMSSYLVNTASGQNVINKIADETDPALRQSYIVDYWLDHHWAGSKGSEKVRNAKKANAYYKIRNENYERNPDWVNFNDSHDDYFIQYKE